jgi:hypothetical protein
MTVWGWIGVAAVGLAVLSIAVGLVIARILGSISAGLNQMLEDESWTFAPQTRAFEAPVDDLAPMRARRATQQRSRTGS